MSHLHDKKDEYRQMKAENDLEREQLRKEEKMAQSFKFTKMSKKTPFFPTLDARGFLQVEPVTSNDNGQKYIDGRDRQALMFPDKVKDNSKTFALQKTCDGSYFTTPVAQQFDKYDLVLQKYMRNPERGIPRPRRNSEAGATQSIHVAKETTFLPGTRGVFQSTDPWPAVLQKTAPLLDRTNPPRRALRAITLDRNYTN